MKEEEMLKSIADMGKEHKEEFKIAIKKIGTNIFEKGMMPKDALGIGDKNVDKLYNEAYQRYNMGKYNDAEKIFGQLLILNPTEGKYVFGLAACAHMKKDFEIAAEQYIRCSLYDPEDPIPYYHASDCYMELNDKLSALISLQMVIKRSGDKPEYKVMKDRALLTIESLKHGANEKQKTTPKLNK